MGTGFIFTKGVEQEFILGGLHDGKRFDTVFEKIINGVSKTLKDITTTPVPPAPQPSTTPVDSEQTSSEQASSEQASSEQASGSAKFCPSCGKALPDGSEFCIYCGTKL